MLAHLLPAIERRPDLLVAHLNDPDTAGHVFGCDTDAAHQRYHLTDHAVGHVVDALRVEWDDLVLIVVSDHDHEMITSPPTDLRADADASPASTRPSARTARQRSCWVGPTWAGG